jgi:hypothetical protein
MPLGIMGLVFLTVFLIAHGQPFTNEKRPDVNEEANELINAASNALADANNVAQIQELREALINYCYQHADRPNPVDDLIDKGFLPPSFKGETCISIKQAYENEKNEQLIAQQKQQQKQTEIEEKQRLQYEAFLKENAMNNTNFNNCLNQNMSVILCYDTHIGNRPLH